MKPPKCPCKDCLVKARCMVKAQKQDSVAFLNCHLVQEFFSDPFLKRRIDIVREELRLNNLPARFNNPFLTERK